MAGYVITILAGFFWFFRVLVSLMYTAEVSFLVTPMNITFEVILLFITFICIILIAKRKMVGAVIYLIAQCTYFGIDAYKSIEMIVNGQGSNVDTTTLFVSFVAVLLPILAIMNIGLSRGKKTSLKNKKTDWFYGTTEYDRKFDERRDENQYKF